VPAELSDLVMQLLAKEPAGRPQTAREVADALAAIERDLTSVEAPPRKGPTKAKPGRDPATQTLPAPAAGTKRRRPWLIAGAVAPLALLSAGAVLFWLKDSSGKGQHGKIEGAKWVKVEPPPPAADFALQFRPGDHVSVPSLVLDRSAPLTL